MFLTFQPNSIFCSFKIVLIKKRIKLNLLKQEKKKKMLINCPWPVVCLAVIASFYIINLRLPGGPLLVFHLIIEEILFKRENIIIWRSTRPARCPTLTHSAYGVRELAYNMLCFAVYILFKILYVK